MVWRIPIGLGLALVVTLLSTWAAAQRDARVAAGSFRVSVTPSTAGVAARIRGQVLNDSPYRVTNVQLQIEGLNTDHNAVGRTYTWAVGDILPGGQTFFAAEGIPGSVSYRITVVSWDLVSFGQTP
jgi:hypothetical protein